MGAWGTAIFSDDFACDVKREYMGLAPYLGEDEAYRLVKEYFF